MAESIRSALFVDYDSIYQSIKAANATAADRLAQRVGRLGRGDRIRPAGFAKEGRRLPAADRAQALLCRSRSFSARRALPSVASGFQMIDCAKADGRARNAADVQIALDAMDALGRAAEYDEFVLLSATADWSPVLLRLGGEQPHARDLCQRRDLAGIQDARRRHRRRGAADAPPLGRRSGGELGRRGRRQEEAARGTARPRRDRGAGAQDQRGDQRAGLLAEDLRRILPRALRGDRRDSGYHFQSTAERVAAKLTAAGRNVTRRQVVFVVKGLALKGHVFSTTDTPERLAEVFREQVLYLVGNAELTLNEREKALLPHWIVGHIAAGQTAELAEPEREPAKIEAEGPPAKATGPSEPPKPAAEEGASRGGRRRGGRGAREDAFAEPAPPVPPVEPPAKPQPVAAKPPEPAPKAEAR